jgi:hypothetical protein
MDDGWDDEEMGLVGAFVLAFSVAAVVVGVTSAAIAWGAVSLASKAVQTVRRR